MVSVHSLVLLTVAVVILLPRVPVTGGEVGSSDRECPTWFIPTESGSCECGSELSGDVHCDDSNGEVSLVLGHCMTYNPSTGTLLTGYTNCGYLGGPSRAYSTIPNESSLVNDFVCRSGSRHRKDFLCGRCMDGYGPAVNTVDIVCAKCKPSFALCMGLLLVILPITVFYAIVIMFHVNLTSSPLLGYVIFCQYITMIVSQDYGLYESFLDRMDRFGQYVLRISVGLSGVWWGFIPVYGLIDPVCYTPNLTHLQKICLGYVIVLYPLALLLVTYVAHKMHERNCRVVVCLWKPFRRCVLKTRRNWSASDSIIHAYATVFFLSSSLLSYVTFNLFFTTNVYSTNGTVVSRVLVYEPTVEVFSSHHLPYAVTAIILYFFLGICPTLVLLFYSTRLFTRCCRLRSRMYVYLRTFAEALHGCYTDGLHGTRDFRFLSPAPLFCYILFSARAVNFVSTADILHYMLSFTLVILTLSFVVGYVRPLKSAYMNFSVSFHLMAMGYSTAVVVLWLDGGILDSRLLAAIFTIVATLPHIFALLTVLYYVLSRIKPFRNFLARASRSIRTVFHRPLEEDLHIITGQAQGIPQSSHLTSCCTPDPL